MDSLITAAARALATGKPFRALNLVALRDDAPAMALRGIALAQLGDLQRARDLLKNAARAFGRKAVVARARCTLASAEIALAARDISGSTTTLEDAKSTLEQHGDRINAAHAQYILVRRWLLLGRLDEAERLLADCDPALYPPSFTAVHELMSAGIALRRLQTGIARSALARAEVAAHRSGIAGLVAEVEKASRILTTPAARLIGSQGTRPLLLEEVEALLQSRVLVVDACRHSVRTGEDVTSFAGRPVLFSLARILGEAWPREVSRSTLIARAFRTRFSDDSHRARLRVEIGRLRRLLETQAEIKATRNGFQLFPKQAGELVVLTHPVEEKHAPVLALLADGEAWSSSALAQALDTSQRTVQRALESLAEAGKVESFGQGRARRWTLPSVPGFTTTLLLPTTFNLG